MACRELNLSEGIEGEGVAVAVLLDTNIFISEKNREEPYYPHSKVLLEHIDDGLLIGLISTVTVAEMCVGYYLFGDVREKNRFITHIRSSDNYKVIDVDLNIAEKAGRIKTEVGIRLPDAILVASAIEKDAYAIVTHDIELRKASKYIKVLSARDCIQELMGRKSLR